MTLRTTRAELVRVSGGRAALLAALEQGTLRVEGRVAALRELLDALDEFEAMFNVVEP